MRSYQKGRDCCDGAPEEVKLRGKRAKILRKAARLLWEEWIKKVPKLPPRTVYKFVKKEYMKEKC